LTLVPDPSSVPPVAPSAANGEKRTVVFGVAPASHLWVAVCLGLAGAFFALTLFLGLGEVLYSAKQLLLESIFSATSS
jgi:hypothetical protein